MKKEEPKFGDTLKEFDFYKDLPKEVAEPTIFGATMSLGILGLMGLLFFYQITEFLTFQTTSEIIIDTSEEDQFVSIFFLKIQFNVNLDITFQETPCSILSLDIVDVTGVHVVNIGGYLEK